MTCDKNNNFKLFILKEKVLFTAAFEIPLHCALSREKERQNNTSDLWLWRQTLFDSFRRVRLTFLTWLFPLHVGWEARPINTPTAHACRSDFNCWCIPGRLNLLSYFDFLAKTSPGLVFFFSLVTFSDSMSSWHEIATNQCFPFPHATVGSPRMGVSCYYRSASVHCAFLLPQFFLNSLSCRDLLPTLTIFNVVAFFAVERWKRSDCDNGAVPQFK